MTVDESYTETMITFGVFKWIIITIQCFDIKGLDSCISWVRHDNMKYCEEYVAWKGSAYLRKLASEIIKNEDDDINIMHKAWESEKMYKVLA